MSERVTQIKEQLAEARQPRPDSPLSPLRTQQGQGQHFWASGSLGQVGAQPSLVGQQQLLQATVDSVREPQLLNQKILADKLDEATTNISQLKLLRKDEARRAIMAEQQSKELTKSQEELRAEMDRTKELASAAQTSKTAAEKLVAQAERRADAAEQRAAGAENELQRLKGALGAGREELDRLREVAERLEDMGEDSIRQISERDKQIEELRVAFNAATERERGAKEELVRLRRREEELQQSLETLRHRDKEKKATGAIIGRALIQQVQSDVSCLRDGVGTLRDDVVDVQRRSVELCMEALRQVKRMQQIVAARRQREGEAVVKRLQQQADRQLENAVTTTVQGWEGDISQLSFLRDLHFTFLPPRGEQNQRKNDEQAQHEQHFQHHLLSALRDAVRQVFKQAAAKGTALEEELATKRALLDDSEEQLTMSEKRCADLERRLCLASQGTDRRLEDEQLSRQKLQVRLDDLHNELTRARQELQAVVEERDASGRAFAAASEELESSLKREEAERKHWSSERQRLQAALGEANDHRKEFQDALGAARFASEEQGVRLREAEEEIQSLRQRLKEEAERYDRLAAESINLAGRNSYISAGANLGRGRSDSESSPDASRNGSITCGSAVATTASGEEAAKPRDTDDWDRSKQELTVLAELQKIQYEGEIKGAQIWMLGRI
jgi:chromosome segregation ATPase